MDPDPTLNFEAGETLYENPGVAEWMRLWKVGLGALAIAPSFYGYEFYKNEGVPSLQWAEDAFPTAIPVPRQWQDGGDIDMHKLLYCDERDYMNSQHFMKRLAGKPFHTFYVATVAYMLHELNFEYATKIVYNKDKDLLYVYKPWGLFGEAEYIHEAAHLEVAVPSAVTSWKTLSMNSDDGIIRVTDLAKQDEIKVYANDKYWNVDLKKEFMEETGHLWRNITHKNSGMLFQVSGPQRQDIDSYRAIEAG